MVDDKPKPSSELKALEVIARELARLTPAEQTRILVWACDRFLAGRVVSKERV